MPKIKLILRIIVGTRNRIPPCISISIHGNSNINKFCFTYYLKLIDYFKIKVFTHIYVDFFGH